MWLMFAVQHLQRQRTELQEEYELLSSTIRRLRDSHAVETDPAVINKLEYQIKDYEERRDSIVPKVEELDTKIDVLDRASNVYNALLKLNYRNQAELFRKLITKSQVGAFLIYGEEDYGQRWLLNRLISRVPCTIAGKIVSINLKSIARRWALNALYRELGRQLGLDSALAPQNVIEQIHGWWQTQTVILIFHNLD